MSSTNVGLSFIDRIALHFVFRRLRYNPDLIDEVLLVFVVAFTKGRISFVNNGLLKLSTSYNCSAPLDILNLLRQEEIDAGIQKLESIRENYQSKILLLSHLYFIKGDLIKSRELNAMLNPKLRSIVNSNCAE